jgi:hypothetical protein
MDAKRKKIYTTCFLLSLMLVSSVSVFSFPRNTDAVGGVGDTVVEVGPNLLTNTLNTAQAVAGHLKGYVLDPLAWTLSKAILQSVVKSTVNWVNNGFNGSPAFVTNLSSTLMNVANTQADSFLRQITTNSAIRSPFQGLVASAVSSSYNRGANGGFFVQNPYTLNKVTRNDTAFLKGNFAQGGLNAWFSEVMNPANNPAGATMIAQGSLGSQVASAVATRSQEVNWAKGVLSFRGSCPKNTPGKATSLSGTDTCAGAPIKTPGTVIEAQLEKSLGSGVDTLVSAHTFDEIIGSVLSQLVNKVVGSAGLSGVSQPTSTGRSFLNQTDTTQTSTNASLATSFRQSLTTQTAQLTSFIQEWQTIIAAAQAAKNAVQSTPSCAPVATNLLATVIQPAIDQGTTEISRGQSALAIIAKIQNEVSGASLTTVQISQASTEYTNLSSSNTLPDASEIAFAQSQSTPTNSANAAPTLITQLTNVSTSAQTGKCSTAGT